MNKKEEILKELWDDGIIVNKNEVSKALDEYAESVVKEVVEEFRIKTFEEYAPDNCAIFDEILDNLKKRNE